MVNVQTPVQDLSVQWASHTARSQAQQGHWACGDIPQKGDNRKVAGDKLALLTGPKEVKMLAASWAGPSRLHCLISRFCSTWWNRFPSRWWSNIFQQIFRIWELCFSPNLHRSFNSEFCSQRAEAEVYLGLSNRKLYGMAETPTKKAKG